MNSSVTIEHIGLYVFDLEGMKDFYIENFGACASEKYENQAKGFESYFLTFSSGARLELMRSAQDAAQDTKTENGPAHSADTGYAHLALSVGSTEAVDRLTAELASRGFTVISQPRRTGDGYYESIIADPEGNRIEITG